MTNSSNKVSLQIYVACLASYNSGKLHGQWINASQDASGIHAEITAMLAKSSEPCAEEWAVHDFEGFDGIDLGEWPDIDRVSAIAKLIEEHGEPFSVWYQNQDGQNVEGADLEESFLEQWQGAFDSEIAFATQLLEDCDQLTELPAWAQNYFDFESYARDLRLGGDYSFIRHDCQTYVYSSH